MKNKNITGPETAEVKKHLQEGRRSNVKESEKERVEWLWNMRPGEQKQNSTRTTEREMGSH